MAVMHLSIAFQPIVRLGGGEVVGHEALLRGPAPPDVLFAQAEREGRLGAFDASVWRLAIAASAAQGGARGRLFLNVDSRALDDGGAEARIAALASELRLAGVSPSTIVLELSENAPTIGTDAGARFAVTAGALGFGVALDDLGAGHASLAALARVRPGIVKIDRGLVHGLDGDRLRRELVAAIVGFAQRAGMELIAEGIETWAELEALRSIGVTLGQGFLLGRPAERMCALAPATAERVVAASPKRSRAAPRRESAMLGVYRLVG